MTTTGSTARPYPFSPPDRLNLDPAYAEVRDGPLVRVRLAYGDDAWLVTRYQDVKTVLSDLRFSRAAAVRSDEPRARPLRMRPDVILSMDPPDHTRLRRLVAKAFTARRVAALHPRTEGIADRLVGEMLAAGAPADLVERFSVPLVIAVICELLGVPFEDRSRFRVWCEAIVATTAYTPGEVQEHTDALRAYVAELIELRRAEPADDLITGFVEARDDHDRLSEAEMVSLAMTLLITGQGATVSQIPNFVYALLIREGAWARLVADPDLIPAAVEELTRHVPLGEASDMARYALEDVELSGGTVRAGEAVIPFISVANRDPAVFDDPEEVVLDREYNPHLGFSHGVHHCLGAQLARQELRVALRVLTRRCPRLRFAVPEPELPWKTGSLARGLTALPVSW
ncbi:cytochrome P450 [Nocardiopsis sediminis]|uniref:Cytochrome P450 n=1 Tax=Nocardiopsis sediminis TaxID=1778267 RepID=A0ABV8FPN9_9ACTN